MSLAGLGSRWGFFQAAEQPQQAVENRQRMGRAAGDVQIDRHDAVGAVVDLGVVAERAARDGARADGDHDLRRGHRLVGLLQGAVSCFRLPGR